MSNFVYFYKNGDIIYNNTNLKNGKDIGIFNDIQNVETINSNDIYYNKKYDKYYHKYILGQSHTFLEWKPNKYNIWEWHKSDYDINDLILLNDVNIDTIIDTNIDKIKIMINISVRNILSQHQYNEEKITEILENIDNINFNHNS